MNYNETPGQGDGEVHASIVPLLTSLGITLSLASLLAPPLLIISAPLLIYSILAWVGEEVELSPFREKSRDEYGIISWAMIWIIITEIIIFASFFAFWFWARWHTLSWEDSLGGSWPALGVEHDMTMVGFNTLILITSGITAHYALEQMKEDKIRNSRHFLEATLLLGAIFLVIQGYEYANAGFSPSSHAYGTAFYAITGFHGLHVVIGMAALGVVLALIRKTHINTERWEGFRAIVWYWHLVDAVWIVVYLVIYWEVI